MPKSNVPASTIALAILAAGEVPNFYSAPLPSMFTIRRFGGREVADETKQDIRRGEVIGSVEAIAVGVATSIIAKHWLPFAAVVAMVILHVLYVYEWSLNHPHPTAEAMV